MSVRDRLAALAQLLPAGVRPAEASLAPALEADREWRRIVKARLIVAVIGVTGWTAVIEARLFWYQVVQHDTLVQRAAMQQQDEVTAPARRGEILDRNGHVLAFSVDADSIVAVPSEVTEPEATARAVCSVIECSDVELARMTERLSRRGAFANLRRFVSPTDARRIVALDLPGINTIQETKRYYPKMHLASHVLGFVGTDNNGLGGVEQAYDTVIKGRDGKIRMQVDARQHTVQSRVELEPTAGASLELTIDQYIQNIAERELKRGVDETRAAGGTAIVMDPRTGEILALANYPTFNPNVYNRAPADTRRNRAIQEIYEPGSTFKIVTASAAIEEGVLSPSDLIDCAPGYITIPGRSRPVRDVHAYGLLSFEDVIVKSSNVGAIKAGLQVGADRLGIYVNRFGFGQRLGPDFRGQSSGIVWKLSEHDQSAIASVSMGYQIGVTPLQMATAVSAIAYGGRLLEPHLVRAMIRDGVRHPVAPKVLRQAIAPSTANTLTTIMEGVVERGTAKAARLDGYRVAGKTGTAAKIVNGGYSKSDYNGSFVGFVPSRKPALTILVVIDSGRTGQGYGGAVAAPVFKRIAEASLRHLGVPRTIDPIPPIFASLPPADAAPAAARTSILASLTPAANLGLMPDLRGLGAREALRVLGRLGVSARMQGSGIVVAQEPEAGTPLERGGWSLLRLGRETGDGTR